MIIDKEHLANVIHNLEKNNFHVFSVNNLMNAYNIFMQKILPEINPISISYADSITLRATGILESLKKMSFNFIETFDSTQTRNEQIENRRRALTVDLFLTGTNAVTEQGQLVNLDMVGNRVAPIVFGPQNVVLFISTKKIVPSLDDAFKRIKNISAPLNAERHKKFHTPCQVTGICQNCKSQDRICNAWTISEKSYPKGRIKIVLIDENIGL